MSASCDVVIAVIITPTCCHQMMLVAPGVGERASAAVGVRPWRPGQRARAPGKPALPAAAFCGELRDCQVHLQIAVTENMGPQDCL